MYIDHILASRIVANLDCILISHMHADHHMGLVRLLVQRTSMMEKYGCRDKEGVEGNEREEDGKKIVEPLLIIGPTGILHWLTELSVLLRVSFCFINCLDIYYGRDNDHVDVRFKSSTAAFRFEALKKKLHLKSLVAVPVWHCHNAFGFVIDIDGVGKVVYSGDTRPHRHLVEAGNDCLVLINEATFEPDMLEDAKQKFHCTVDEAIAMGDLMNARHIILNHFSQRYPRITQFTSREKERESPGEQQLSDGSPEEKEDGMIGNEAEMKGTKRKRIEETKERRKREATASDDGGLTGEGVAEQSKYIGERANYMQVDTHEATANEGSEENIAGEKREEELKSVSAACTSGQRSKEPGNNDWLGRRSIFIAFDLMTVPFSHLHLLPSLLPAVTLVLAEEDEKEEESKDGGA